MKFSVVTLFSLITIHCCAQNADTSATTFGRNVSSSRYSSGSAGNNTATYSFRLASPITYKTLGNIAFGMRSFEMTPKENEIAELESVECAAVKARDTVMLRRLWLRDFTQDEPQNEVSVNGRNSLPYYTSLTRIVENYSLTDDQIFTSGYEMVQLLKIGGALEDPARRNYFHTWTKIHGAWKLTSKTHN